MGDFSEDAFVKIVGTSGNYRYGYVKKVQERGFHLVICLHDEGDSAIEYEAANQIKTEEWDKILHDGQILSDSEKKLIPLLAQNLATKEIAAALSVSPITIRAQIRTLRLKLQLDNRQQLAALSVGLEKRLKERQS